MNPEDERWMARALELARKELFTSPNPRVGAVIVRDGRIVGEGFHRGSGTPHAEAAALDGAEASGATLYVNLEPCSHTGLTPPCAEAIAQAGIVRVVAAITDPDPRVSGGGFSYLEGHGVAVEAGVLAAEATLLNAAFLHRVRTGRPLVSLKLACSVDGKMAALDGSSKWITSMQTRRYVHERRAGSDAILIGAGTIVADDPSLTARDVASDHQPVRVVVDAHGKVDPDAAVFGPGEVILATGDGCSHERQTEYKEAGAELLMLPKAGNGVHLGALLEALSGRGWSEILCEGGARLATSLLAGDHVDLLEMHYGPTVLGAGLTVGDIGVTTMDDAPRFVTVDVRRSAEDAIVILSRRPL